MIFSCTEKDKKKDNELNTYYSKYVYIYNNYDSLGYDKSMTLLDEYIEEFPNAQNAYLFKAFLMTGNGKLSETEALFQKALSFDSANAEIYLHWASLLLTDTNEIEKAKEVNSLGKTLDSTNLLFDNNMTWVYLYENETENALENAKYLVSATQNQNNTLNRALAIAAAAAKNDSIYTHTLPSIAKDETETQNLEAFKNGEMSLNALYNSLTK